MRRRTWASFGIGATATVAATAVLSGVASNPGSPLGQVVTPPAAAAELETFDGCDDLLRWYVDAALPHVGPWGLGGWPVELTTGRAVAVAGAAEAAPRDADVAEDAVAGSATGTNVQEAGVDEPDLAKTDGRILAHVDGRRLVVSDVSGAEPRELSTLGLPRALGAVELLLVGDRIVVLGAAGGWGGPIPVDTSRDLVAPGWGEAGSTRALVVDVGDPASPRVEHDTTIDGSLVSARQHGDAVRLVVSTQSPAIDFVQPRRGLGPAEAKEENRRRVRASSIDDWLPRVEGAGSSQRLVDCSSVHHPDQASGYGTVTVVSFDPGDPADRRTTAVTTGSDLVYSSADRLYLSTRQRRSSGVHAFALDGLESTYVASGTVPGHVRDRWSFSEYDGHLRVATALGKDAWQPEENAVVVLRESGSDLVEVGRVARMGIREQIQSVRWFDDLAVVVTFRQVDPLYTVDLSDPTAPRVVGELKIPGFSAYLHPLGDDLLLGLGQDADLGGRTRGAQAAVFDLRDLTAPERLDTAGFGPDTEFLASWDPRSLTYLPETRTVLATLSDWRRGGTHLTVMKVGEEGRLRVDRTRKVAGWDGALVRTLPLGDGRVALVTGAGVELLTP
ncbi:MAG TPA: beta-propeller domain-containing protein [Nocardioidaceae bacterium]|nr:beta-propeller domain-containing protein [Nocardioidaceae bacterium]